MYVKLHAEPSGNLSTWTYMVYVAREPFGNEGKRVWAIGQFVHPNIDFWAPKPAQEQWCRKLVCTCAQLLHDVARKHRKSVKIWSIFVGEDPKQIFIEGSEY